MSVPTNNCGFFKVVDDAAIREAKLSVPLKFARDNGDRLLSPLTLEAPTGDKWRVNLLKQEHRIWLQEGWKEFADFYGLRPRYVVIFLDDGGNRSHFLVHVMDSSTAEINYPVRGRNVAGDHGKRSRNNGGEVPIESEGDPVEEAADCICCDPHPQNCRVGEGRRSGFGMEQDEEKAVRIVDISTEGIRVKGHKRKGRVNSEIIAATALNASISFTSQYPYFKLVVELMHLERNCVDIPYDLVKELPAKRQIMTLEIGGRRWEVKLSKFPSINRGRLSIGWLLFARQNGLKVGDICIFELIAAAKFNVAIFSQSA